MCGIECNSTIGGEGGVVRIEAEQIKKKEAMKEKRGGYLPGCSLHQRSCCCGVGVSLCVGREGNDRGCLFPG